MRQLSLTHYMLPITEMASVLQDPGRMIGLHFFNPAHRMQLLEVICAQKTSDQTLASSVAFARAIKKIPIVVNDGPGFYVSRQLAGLFGGAIFLTGDGVDGAAVEAAMLDFGMPMGPAALFDLTGIDIGYHVAKTYEKRLGERYRIHPLFERIYETGCYGRKTGAGYFDYSGDEPVPNPKVVEVVQNYLKENNVSPREMSNQDIIDSMLALGINEAVPSRPRNSERTSGARQTSPSARRGFLLGPPPQPFSFPLPAVPVCHPAQMYPLCLRTVEHRVPVGLSLRSKWAIRNPWA